MHHHFFSVALASILCSGSLAFVPSSPSLSFATSARDRLTIAGSGSGSVSVTALNAIGVLARKAKENDVRKYCEGGVEEAVLAKVSEMKANLESESESEWSAGPLQQRLTKRKGTITIVAEYKRKFAVEAGFAGEGIFEPEVMSPTFREFGAAALAVMADERIGGCGYDDIREFVAEQESARGEMPGPLPVISNDLIVDEVQIARSAAYGAQAVVLNIGMLGTDKIRLFLRCVKALDLEAIVAVSSKEEAQSALDCGATILSVVGVDDVDEKVQVIADLNVPDNVSLCTIANILANNNKALEEVEEAWICRDKGFNTVWVSDALYKSGNDPNEHAGAIIKSMSAKSSVKWASAKAMSGRGEGAREYLGDILM